MQIGMIGLGRMGAKMTRSQTKSLLAVDGPTS